MISQTHILTMAREWLNHLHGEDDFALSCCVFAFICSLGWLVRWGLRLRGRYPVPMEQENVRHPDWMYE